MLVNNVFYGLKGWWWDEVMFFEVGLLHLEKKGLAEGAKAISKPLYQVILPYAPLLQAA